ncbi:DUF1642 domain-containing protein [Jeotgalibaca porci]|uniref:DUF1642 domain-containing protein n=1 Tax=Jeotgalibaca porci TaxID=1868793 RepID=UPI0035A13E9B
MNKKEFIKTLIDMGGCDAKQGTWERGWDAAISDVIAIAEELDEPEQTDIGVGLSKPVIPKFVADWFENDKRDMEIEDVFWQIENCEMVNLDVDRWISDNRNTFIRAWLDGYEVEKEKKYYIYDKSTRGYLGYNADKTRLSWYTRLFPNEVFTEQEIKAIDERYWAFAQEVAE